MAAEKFSFMALILPENTFVTQEIESAHVYSCPQAKPSPDFIMTSRQTEVTHFP